MYMIAYDEAGNERKSKEEVITTLKVPDAVDENNIKTGAITFTDSGVWSNYKTSTTINTTNATGYNSLPFLIKSRAKNEPASPAPMIKVLRRDFLS